MTTNEARKIGVFGASAIVAGNMMGSGIALLPSNLAKIGSISIFAWGIVGFGALALAFVYARLGTENPQAGGPVAYAGEVSPILGFQTGVLYFHANWIGNLAIAITGVAYLSVFFPTLTQPRSGRNRHHRHNLVLYRHQSSGSELDRAPGFHWRYPSSDSGYSHGNLRMDVF